MDNLFAAKKLLIGEKLHAMSKYDVHGVSGASGRGILSENVMDNPTKTTKRNELVGATKASVLRG